jgi:predicted metal-dependent enzyme (double-stranded beta helix superfamily)
MNTKRERREAIEEAIADIKGLLDESVSVESLNQAKIRLMALCEKKALFSSTDFPIPEREIDRTYLVHEEAGGSYALYVNSSLPGQSSAPHDHGGAWAIVAAVVGEETHRLYACEGENGERVKQVSELTVRPGTAVSMLPDGIHAIDARGDAPLLHLHLYGQSFERQSMRRQFDLDAGTVRLFVLEDVGFVEDAR